MHSRYRSLLHEHLENRSFETICEDPKKLGRLESQRIMFLIDILASFLCSVSKYMLRHSVKKETLNSTDLFDRNQDFKVIVVNNL